jgi:hypothetical protein
MFAVLIEQISDRFATFEKTSQSFSPSPYLLRFSFGGRRVNGLIDLPHSAFGGASAGLFKQIFAQSLRHGVANDRLHGASPRRGICPAFGLRLGVHRRKKSRARRLDRRRPCQLRAHTNAANQVKCGSMVPRCRQQAEPPARGTRRCSTWPIRSRGRSGMTAAALATSLWSSTDEAVMSRESTYLPNRSPVRGEHQPSEFFRRPCCAKLS